MKSKRRVHRRVYIDNCSILIKSKLLNDKTFRFYCGNVNNINPNHNCFNSKVRWSAKINQFKCSRCGWISNFDKEFIDKYKLIRNTK